MLMVIACVLCILLGAAGAYMLIDYGYRAGAALGGQHKADPAAVFPRVAPGLAQPRNRTVFTQEDYNHMQKNGRATVLRQGRQP